MSSPGPLISSFTRLHEAVRVQPADACVSKKFVSSSMRVIDHTEKTQ